MPEPRHIVAIGGGGFLDEPENPLLDDYLLALTRRPRPRILFVPTASGDKDDHIVKFYQAFPAHSTEPTHLALFERTVDNLEAIVMNQDIVFVGAGNAANLLSVWRIHGLDQILRAAWEAGVVLAGVGAGALCWCNGGTTDSFGTEHRWLNDGLALVPSSMCAHYSTEPRRRTAHHKFLEMGFPGGWGVDDGCALHFVGAELEEILSSRKGAAAYRLEANDAGHVSETKMDARYLG